MAKSNQKCARGQSFVDRIRAVVNQFDGLRTLGPVYVTSIGLAVAYSWGWVTTYPGAFGTALACVVCTAELLKPVIGPRIEDRLAEPGGGRKACALLVVAALTMAFCGLSGVVAFNAAEAPTRAYEESQRAVARADADIAARRADLARFDCTADMPATRCDAMKERNAGAEARAARALAEAEAARGTIQRDVAPAPAVLIPHMEWIVKLMLGLGIDFVLFIFPWAERASKANAVKRVVAAEPAAPVAKVNDGGWSTRRAKYGATGRRRKPKLVVNNR